jgi:hypothetical protein
MIGQNERIRTPEPPGSGAFVYARAIPQVRVFVVLVVFVVQALAWDQRRRLYLQDGSRERNPRLKPVQRTQPTVECSKWQEGSSSLMPLGVVIHNWAALSLVSEVIARRASSPTTQSLGRFEQIRGLLRRAGSPPRNDGNVLFRAPDKLPSA